MKTLSYLFILALLLNLPHFTQAQNKQKKTNLKKKKWKGQAAIQKVSTITKPIQKQFKGVFDLGNGVACSNNFLGARLNGVARTNDTLITGLIMPENAPINPSPWYAFKIWSKIPKTIYFHLTYLPGTRHRYYPKMSQDGKTWKKLPKENYTKGKVDPNKNPRNLPFDITMKLRLSPDTLWIAAQELNTSIHNQVWVNRLSKLPYVSQSVIGQSKEGKPIHLLKIGQASDKKMMMVLSGQHPPEVTGYLAMQSFVEMVSSDHPVAKKFRKKYNTYVVPMVNPDGIDHGHWRHNSGGIDLNRDWEATYQPETRAVQRFMKQKAPKGKFYFAVDFHSTWEDIYYTINPKLKGNMPGLVPNMIAEMKKALPSLDPNIRPGLVSNRSYVTSSGYFFFIHKAEALTFEIGDNTPRPLLKKKGEMAALQLMKLMLKKK